MPPAKQLSTEPVTKRIHVGNLAPSVSKKDLVQRFSSFGSIQQGEQGVDGLGTNEFGLPRPFAFFNLETTEAKFAKCMSMLNGSMWKAHKLRIAPAKADWQQTRAAEREEARKLEEEPPRPKKRKRSKDPNVGRTATHFELVTEDNLKRHQGWILDPKPVPAPLFPLIVRPPHPIELPSKPAATAWTRGKAKPNQAARQALKAGVPLDKPSLRRAKRIRIDPRRFGRSKLVFGPGEENAAANMLAVGTWECEEVELEEGAEPVARWVFKAKDGSVKMRETVRLSQQTVYTDQFTAMLERMNRPRAAAPTPAAPIVADPLPSTSASADSPSPSDAEAIDASPRPKRQRSVSPPPYIPAAPRNLMYNEEDAFQLMAAALGDDERDAAHAMERSEYVKLALGAAAEVGEAIEDEVEVEVRRGADGKPLPKVEGFADDDDDDSDLFPVMRLRGGGGVESDSDSSDSSEDDDSDSDSSSSDDEEDSEGSSKTEKQESVGDVEMAEAEQPQQKKAIVKEGLKDMFRPQEESAGFSLLSGLDLDLDLDRAERSPSPAPIPLPSAAPTPAPRPAYRGPLGPHPTSALPSGPSAPFFAFPSGEFEDRLTGELKVDAVEKLGVSKVAIDRSRAENERRLGDAAKDFWRTESMEQIEEEHQKLREALRGVARKRHREAIKRSKKTAGRRNGGAKLDIGDDE
ncbi:hypothetical protein JCM8097_001547 [Rhodosporidiobolus ruineniae]